MDTPLWLIPLLVNMVIGALLGALVLVVVHRRLATALLVVQTAARARAVEQDAALVELTNRVHVVELAYQNVFRQLADVQAEQGRAAHKADALSASMTEIQQTLRVSALVTQEMARILTPQVFARPGMQFNGPASINGPVVGGDVGHLTRGGNGAPEGGE